EDGIRDKLVTGVQTCALPILTPKNTSSMYIEITHPPGENLPVDAAFERALADLQKCGILRKDDRILTRQILDIKFGSVVFDQHRSEERRVGKECRTGWVRLHW